MTEAAVWRIALRTIFLVAALLLVALIVRELRSVIVQLLLAVLIASAATPIVNGMTVSSHAQRWRWRPARSLAALIVFFAAILVLVLASLVVAATIAPD